MYIVGTWLAMKKVKLDIDKLIEEFHEERKKEEQKRLEDLDKLIEEALEEQIEEELKRLKIRKVEKK